MLSSGVNCGTLSEEQCSPLLLETLRNHPAIAGSGMQKSVPLQCADWMHFLELYRKDISHGRLFIETDTPEPMSSEIAVTIIPPEQVTPFRLSAQVVHVVSPAEASQKKIKAGMGVQLATLVLDQAVALEALVQIAQTKCGITRTSGHHRAVTNTSSTGTRRVAIRPVTTTKHAVESGGILEQLKEKMDWFRRKDPLEALGVAKPVNPDFARKAYFKLCKRYHPDLFTRYNDEEITRVVTELFALIRNAYALALKQAPDVTVPTRRKGS